MAPSMSKKRKFGDGLNSTSAGPLKKSHKTTHYSSLSPSTSSAGEDFVPISLVDSDVEKSPSLSKTRVPALGPASSPSPADSAAESSSELPSDENSEDEDFSEPNLDKRKTRKANDPVVFSNSIVKILGSKLSTSKRADPVLARSTTAQEANESLSNSRLEAKARRKLREDKQKDLEKGRIKDALLGTDAPRINTDRSEGPRGIGACVSSVSVGDMLEQEKRLRKTAQRGVVKLFNAVRAAQVKGEEAARNVKGGGRDRKKERVGEMSKQGFLELVAGGGFTGQNVTMRTRDEEG